MAVEEELLEHMEHAASTFDRRVAVTMAIVAAILAWVTMLSHRAHNDTLILQADSNRMRTEAGTFHTRESDQWSFFQAKNIRNYETRAFTEILSVMAKAPGADASKNAANFASQWGAQVKKYEQELPQLRSEAEALAKQAHEREQAAEAKLTESYAAHERGERYDLSELAVEIALVLCSLAVLTKRRPFWYSGMAVCVAGLAAAVSGILMK